MIAVRQFPVPFDMQSEDKIIGGYLSLRQLFWVFIVPVITLISLLILNRSYILNTQSDVIKINVISLIIRIIIVVIVWIAGTILAFYKPNNISADKYLLKVILYKLRNHTVKFGR